LAALAALAAFFDDMAARGAGLGPETFGSMCPRPRWCAVARVAGRCAALARDNDEPETIQLDGRSTFCIGPPMVERTSQRVTVVGPVLGRHLNRWAVYFSGRLGGRLQSSTEPWLWMKK